MRSDHGQPRPANDLYAVPPWATWPTALLAAWSHMAFAGLDCWAAAHRVWLDTGRDLALSAPATDMTDDPLVAATVRDWRSCGEALMQAQIETIESWRRAS